MSNIFTDITEYDIELESLQCEMNMVRALKNMEYGVTGITEAYSEYDEYATVTEGVIGDFFRTIWDAIKSVFERIIDFFKNLFGGGSSGGSTTAKSDAKTPSATSPGAAKEYMKTGTVLTFDPPIDIPKHDDVHYADIIKTVAPCMLAIARGMLDSLEIDYEMASTMAGGTADIISGKLTQDAAVEKYSDKLEPLMARESQCSKNAKSNIDAVVKAYAGVASVDVRYDDDFANANEVIPKLTDGVKNGDMRSEKSITIDSNMMSACDRIQKTGGATADYDKYAKEITKVYADIKKAFDKTERLIIKTAEDIRKTGMHIPPEMSPENESKRIKQQSTAYLNTEAKLTALIKATDDKRKQYIAACKKIDAAAKAQYKPGKPTAQIESYGHCDYLKSMGMFI